MIVDGYTPPPYPYDRLDGLRERASAAEGGLVDCSIGTPCDPVPEVARRAAAEALASSAGYPASAGSPAFRAAAADWLGRRFGVEVSSSHVAACVGTKEFVASLPHLLRMRDPSRDTVLYPAVSYPTYEMGAIFAGCRAVPVPLDGEWHLNLAAVTDADAARALVLWLNEPGNPTASAVDREWFAMAAAWARDRGIVVASDECYAEFAPQPETILTADVTGVIAVHSVSKRSNLAGGRVGFYVGDPEIVEFLTEMRKHGGLMVATAMQAAASAALGDDEHVERQREEYRHRRAIVLEGMSSAGLRHAGGPTVFYLWLASDDDTDDGWTIAARLADAGMLVSPGDLYGAAGARYARLALVQPTPRLELAMDRLAAPRAES